MLVKRCLNACSTVLCGLILDGICHNFSLFGLYLVDVLLLARTQPESCSSDRSAALPAASPSFTTKIAIMHLRLLSLPSSLATNDKT